MRADRLARAPRRAVVTEDRLGQTIEGKRGAQGSLDRQASLIGSRFEGEVEAAVVIEDCQRVAAGPALRGEVAFKVHLPQLVWLRPLEALQGTGRWSLPVQTT